MRINAMFGSGGSPIFGDNGRWSITNLWVKIYPEWICRRVLWQMTPRIACRKDAVIAPSFCLPAHSYCTVWSNLQSSPQDSSAPLANPPSPPSAWGSLLSLWQQQIYSQFSLGTRNKTLTYSISHLKCVLLHWLNSRHNLLIKEEKRDIYDYHSQIEIGASWWHRRKGSYDTRSKGGEVKYYQIQMRWWMKEERPIEWQLTERRRWQHTWH